MPEAISTLTAEQGSILLLLARKSLLNHFSRQLSSDQQELLEAGLKDEMLQSVCGVFVTLKIGERLRGCIGTLAGRQPLIDGVQAHALDAALRDPRFRALSAAELEDIVIEVSVLTPPQPFDYADADDLAARLRPFVDGVTIRSGYYGATFLPQVWEQLPRPEEFLSHLCLKAGLSGSAWRDSRLQVEIYQVQHFQENRPAPVKN